MKIKTAELIGPAMDWAVARCEGKELVFFDDWFRRIGLERGYSEDSINQHLGWEPYKGMWVELEEFTHQPQLGEPEILKRATAIAAYSANWALGGPVIEREGIAIQPHDSSWCFSFKRTWIAAMNPASLDSSPYEGLTPLMAALRCFVASKLGGEVDVPDELLAHDAADTERDDHPGPG